MLITKQSIISRKTHTLDIPITQAQYDLWQSGTLIQDAMPHHTSSQREFLITGIIPEEWDSVMGQEDGPSTDDPNEPAF